MESQRLLFGVLIALSRIFYPSIIYTQSPGSLDPTFDSDGKVTVSVDTGSGTGCDVLLQPDGKILLTGYSHNGSNYDFAIIRCNIDGSLDSTFDGDGKQITAIGPGSDVCYAAALQLDGKIVLAGYTDYGATQDFVVIRYNSNGSLDSSFDSDGIVITDFGGVVEVIHTIAVQVDGKILVGGTVYMAADYDFALARYNTDGSLDSTFDGDGRLTTDIGSISDFGGAIALQPDGKIVMAGNYYTGTEFDYVLTRYNSDGSLDNTFDFDGMVITDVLVSDYARAVSVQSDGKILVTGYSFSGTANNFSIVRYNSDGSLDVSFDTDGKQTTAFGSINDQGRKHVIQPDGRILLTGSSDNGTNNDFALVRYNSDGSLDNTFDSDGKLITNFGLTNDVSISAVIQSDGKILVGGGSNGDFALARYSSGLIIGLDDFSLINNSVLIYPNPISKSTKLTYVLDKQENISICLMNLYGEIMDEFLSGEQQEPGIHTLTLNFSENLTSGTYFVIISTAEKKLCYKVIK